MMESLSKQAYRASGWGLGVRTAGALLTELFGRPTAREKSTSARQIRGLWSVPFRPGSAPVRHCSEGGRFGCEYREISVGGRNHVFTLAS